MSCKNSFAMILEWRIDSFYSLDVDMVRAIISVALVSLIVDNIWIRISSLLLYIFIIIVV